MFALDKMNSGLFIYRKVEQKMEQHQKFMERAIELAKKGIGKVNPNPLVGAVVVKDGEIIGEGYHFKAGMPHAERVALANCRKSVENATLYVTLEPCCHQGRTPPCTDAIIENKISKVVIGSSDPNPLVAGKGVEILKNHHIQVEEGCMREACDALNEIFFHYIKTKRPYVIMKYGMTADGKIATVKGFSKWITSEESRKEVHQTRKMVSGIMVGVETVLQDNPMLDCRIEDPSQPVRIVCDSHLRTPLTSNVVVTANEIPTWIATVEERNEKWDALQAYGVKIIQTKKEQEQIDLLDLMKQLGEAEIDSILLEGGGTLNFSALSAGIVSKLHIYIAPKIFGGENAKTPVAGKGIDQVADAFLLSEKKVRFFGDDIFLTFRIKEK